MKLVDFFNFWFKGTEAFVEFKCIGDGGEGLRTFRDVNVINTVDLQQLVEYSTQNNQNVYFSVATMGEIGRIPEDYVHDIPGYWFNIDLKHTTVNDAVQKVSNLSTPPSAIISSGNSIQVYFKFDRPYRVTGKEPKEMLKGLSNNIMLSLPESLNFKGYNSTYDL